MKKILLFLFFPGLSLFSFSQQNVSIVPVGFQSNSLNQGVLSFFVTDAEKGYGTPAVIILSNEKESVTLQTNDGGHLTFNGSEGKYDVTIAATGYNPLATYFYIEQNKTVNIEAILDKQFKTPLENITYSAPVVEGYVIDFETGKPMGEVEVELTNEKLKTKTNDQGFFSILPSKFSVISKVEDIAIRSNFSFSMDGYSTHTVENLLMIPDKIKLKIALKKGSGTVTDKYIQHVLDGTAQDVELYEKALLEESLSNQKSGNNPPPNLAACIVPPTIRVGTSCSCTNCSGVSVMSLQYYSESGLDNEWISSWQSNSLKAGSIPYRTYGGYYVNNPVKPGYDIASSTCNQVWGSNLYSSTQSAAQATSNQILTANNVNPARSEYSAQNNYGGTSYNCSNCSAGGSGSYGCYSDNVCCGKSPAGHGRGMCQWGTQYWAQNGQNYSWMLNHYFFATIGYTLCGGYVPPTNLSISKFPDCNDKNVVFNWTNSASNWNIDITTNNNWSSWDVKFGVNGTSETGAAGFSGGLAFQPGVTYYWRIYDGTNFTYGPSFTMPNCDPLGHIDIYDCGSIEGWAFDPDYNNQSIDVHIYIDGFFAAALTTTHPRADVNSFFSITGVHGFIWNVPVSYQDANSHLIQVYAINVPSGNNPLIGTGNIGPCVPVNLQSSSNTICENDNVVLSWTNSGSSWYIDISTSPTFATYSNKVIPNLTSTNAPAGFSPAFTFQPNTVYYWRIWNGSGVHTVAPSSITVNPTPSAAVITVSDDSICPGFSTTIWASGSVGGTVDHNFYDAPSGGTLLGQDSITVSPLADFTYYLELINQFGCKSIPNPTAIPIVVNPVPSTPTVLAIPDSVCLGDTAQIVASGSTGGIVSYNFYNALNAGTLLGPAPLTESPPASTVYYLEAINQYGCIADTGRVPVLLTINPLPDDPTLVAGDISICYSDSTWLVANSATPNASISWWNASTGGTVLVLGDTFSTPPLFTSEIYYTQAKSPEGCLNPGGRIPINVTVNPLPIITLSNDAVTFNSIFEGQIITFTADPPGLISYTFFLDSIPAQIAASNTFPTNFIKDQQTVAVIATDINGCKNLYDDNMKIEVKPRSNAFTPNGDGINDLFLNGLEISIINRWGMVLYEGKNGWDGQNKGKNLPDGTYYYIIKLYSLSNEITQISGPVTLMR